jgi:hypothetical protein
MIRKSGGKTGAEQVVIPYQKPVPVKFEQNFDKTFPIFRDRFDKSFTEELLYEFTGNGYIFYGNLVKCAKVDKNYIDRVSKRVGSEAFALAEPDDPYVAELEVFIDDQLDQTVKMPMKNASRRLEPVWKYQLTEGKHTVRVRWVNPDPAYEIRINDIMIYSENPPVNNLQ